MISLINQSLDAVSSVTSRAYPIPPSCPSCFLLHQCHITPTHVHCRYRPFIYHVFTAIFKFNHTKTCVRYRQPLLTIYFEYNFSIYFYVVGNYVLKLYCVSDNLSIIFYKVCGFSYLFYI